MQLDSIDEALAAQPNALSAGPAPEFPTRRSSPSPLETRMLTIAQLSHTYANGTRALSGVTLDIPKGMFGLLGPNGAGKST